MCVYTQSKPEKKNSGLPNGHNNEHLQILANVDKEKYILNALAPRINFNKNKKSNRRNAVTMLYSYFIQ